MKKIRIIIALLIACACVFIVYVAYLYYSPPSYRRPYQIKKQGDTLQIAYIGDSWALMHREHNCQIAKLLEDTLHRPVEVHSYGVCGLTSKELYEKMFDNSNFRNFLQKRGYEYCFVSAGINDSYKKMCTAYYKKSMDGIVQFLLANHIHPIILEIPDYNIQKVFDRQTLNRKILRHLSMFINNMPIDCKQLYRDALDEMINAKGYQNLVRIIHYRSWNNNFNNDLKVLYQGDGMHLNKLGYEKLDSVIVKEIILSLSRDTYHYNSDTPSRSQYSI